MPGTCRQFFSIIWKSSHIIVPIRGMDWLLNARRSTLWHQQVQSVCLEATLHVVKKKKYKAEQNVAYWIQLLEPQTTSPIRSLLMVFYLCRKGMLDVPRPRVKEIRFVSIKLFIVQTRVFLWSHVNPQTHHSNMTILRMTADTQVW